MSLPFQRALVTGGGGFLGRGIIDRLLDADVSVVSLARGEYPDLEKRGVTVTRGDIADPQFVTRAARDCDVVFHVAAKAGIWGKRDDFFATNVTGTVNVLASCVQNSISRLIYTSSPSVVSNGGNLEAVDESAPYADHYLADYPHTKAQAERMVLEANAQIDGLSTVALRPHLIWGPGDNHLVPRIVARGRRRRLRLIGDGSNRVDSVYIDNAVDAHLLAAERLGEDSPIAGQAYFITNGEPLAMSDLLGRILQAADLPPITQQMDPERAFRIGRRLEKIYRFFRVRREPPMTRFLAHQLSTTHFFDISASKRDLGFEPKVSIEEGMKRLRHWLHSPSPTS